MGKSIYTLIIRYGYIEEQIQNNNYYVFLLYSLFITNKEYKWLNGEYEYVRELFRQNRFIRNFGNIPINIITKNEI